MSTRKRVTQDWLASAPYHSVMMDQFETTYQNIGPDMWQTVGSGEIYTNVEVWHDAGTYLEVLYEATVDDAVRGEGW